MKRILLLAALFFMAAAGWQIGQKLSADAISMGIGILLGLLASIPAALLVLAASRRNETKADAPPRGGHQLPGGQGYQAPVIVLAPPMHGYGTPPTPPMQQPYLPASHQIVDGRAGRQFKMVGEEESWVEEY